MHTEAFDTVSNLRSDVLLPGPELAAESAVVVSAFVGVGDCGEPGALLAMPCCKLALNDANRGAGAAALFGVHSGINSGLDRRLDKRSNLFWVLLRGCVNWSSVTGRIGIRVSLVTWSPF